MHTELYRVLLELLESDTPCASVTIVSSSGSIPNAVGAQMIVDARGQRCAGTVGGGAIEHRAIEQCVQAIAEGQHRNFTWYLVGEDAGGIGMMCGGKAELFVHVHRARPQLILVGAGHINLELARLATLFEYQVTVIDDRSEWASAEHYPGATLVLEEPAVGLSRVRWTRECYVVIATRDRDTPALRSASETPCRYIGLVASKRKALVILRQLADSGLDVAQLLPRLYAPVGLNLGGRSPAEIALSIMAEVQLLRSGGKAEHMRVTERDFAPPAR